MKPNPCRQCGSDPERGYSGIDSPDKLLYFVRCFRCGNKFMGDGVGSLSKSRHKRMEYVTELWNIRNPLVRNPLPETEGEG